MDLPSKYQIKEEVIATIEGKAYKGRIHAVIFSENRVTYDVLMGENMYAPDLEEDEISKPRRWRARVR